MGFIPSVAHYNETSLRLFNDVDSTTHYTIREGLLLVQRACVAARHSHRMTQTTTELVSLFNDAVSAMLHNKGRPVAGRYLHPVLQARTGRVFGYVTMSDYGWKRRPPDMECSN
jgi:hypothetical protein